MARLIGKLSPLTVKRETKKGLYPDGGNLYLQVVASGAKSWIFRYMMDGKAKNMGLGALHSVSLAQAREKAADCRKFLSEGIDPLQARKDDQAKAKLVAARSKTFKECAEAYMEAHKVSWRNAKHAWQWENTLKRFVYPALDGISVQDVDVTLVTKILEPIWNTKTETASRVRGRIEVILDWATAREFRHGENPARWRGHLENLLPHRSKIQVVEHHPSLPYDQIGDFMVALKKHGGTAASAMAFTILTAARTSEATGAIWDEFDLQKKIWTVPGKRIKTGREHRVPLSEDALKILRKMKSEQEKTGNGESKIVFPGLKEGKGLSNTAMLMLLRRMKRDDISVHGFRATFRIWAAEQTHFAREVAEAALAHKSGDKVEQAYMRSDLFDRRRQLMDAWARYCATPSAKGNNVLQLAAR